MRRSENAHLKGPMGVSLALHLTLVALVMLGTRKGEEIALPPVYKVNIVAAPAGPRAIGVVQPEPATTPPAAPPAAAPPPPPPLPATQSAVPTTKVAPQSQSRRATPT
ncbi:MAG: hypothetical protein ACSLFK_05555, partial [Gemmatimonadaceae bacterium]